jgi:hypothetical protein
MGISFVLEFSVQITIAFTIAIVLLISRER